MIKAVTRRGNRKRTLHHDVALLVQRVQEMVETIDAEVQRLWAGESGKGVGAPSRHVKKVLPCVVVLSICERMRTVAKGECRAGACSTDLAYFVHLLISENVGLQALAFLADSLHGGQ